MGPQPMTLACSATRVAVGVSVICALLHGGLLIVGGGAMLAMTAPMLILALACAACGRHLWHRASGPGFVVMGTAAAAMVSLHLILEHGHVASPQPSGGDHVAGLLMHLGVTLALVQILLVTVAVLLASWRSRTARLVQNASNAEFGIDSADVFGR